MSNLAVVGILRVVMRSEFHALMGELAYPMIIVTATARGERAGCLVGFHGQASIDPPRFLVLLSNKNHTYRIALDADLLAVHFLSKRHRDLAALFGEETGDRTDKFSRVPWREGPRGVPLLADCADWFAGQVLERVSVGDHMAFLLAPVAAATAGPFDQLVFPDVADLEAGHEA